MLLVCSETEQIPIKHELVEEYVSQEKNVYYITDIHLEDQMKEILCGNDIDFCNIKQKIHDFIEAKVNEMLSGIDDKTGILLVGGDVSHFVELYSFFINNCLGIGAEQLFPYWGIMNYGIFHLQIHLAPKHKEQFLKS